jgi:hypothetical protein
LHVVDLEKLSVIARASLKACAVALVLAFVALFAPAAFGSATDVIRDCSEDGVLNGHYSHSELAKALDKLPSDLDEYTDCRAVIRSAELRAAKKSGGPPPAASPPSPIEKSAIDKAAKSGSPVTIGGKGIQPGASGAPFKAAGLGTDLPALVLAVLAGLIGAMIAGAVLAIQRHRPALARAMPAPLRRLTETLRDGISRFRR